MHLLFTRFPLESTFGGTEVQTLALMEGLQQRGHSIEFLGSCPILCEGMIKLQIPTTELEIGDPPVTKWGVVSFCWRKSEMRRKLVEEFTRCLDLRQCVIPSSPSVSEGVSRDSVGATRHDTCVFMLSLSEKLLLTDWAVAQGMHVFWIEHDRIGRWLTANPWLPKLRRLSALATTIVVSDLSRDLYLKLGWDPKKVVRIPNGIDLTSFSPSPTPSPNPSPFHIGCIARLTHDKGIDLLIEAIVDLPNITLTMIGTGREEKNIRMLANQKLKTNTYALVADVHNISSFYHSLDALILPSREHDPFGLVVAEAMASGVPVIVTDACGIAQHLVKDEDALIVPAGSARVLMNAIKTLQESPQLRKKLSERGPIVARKRFSQERMVHEYEALLL